MEMDGDVLIDYAVRQRRTAQDGGSSSNGPGDGIWFSLHFELQLITRSPIYVIDDAGDVAFDEYDRHSIQTTVDRLLSSQLLDVDSAVISLALLSIGVPIDCQEPIIDGIREKANFMCNDPANAGHNLLHMEVSIRMDTIETRMTPLPEIEIERVDLATTESLIEALERVKIDSEASTSQCAICMEEILQGMEANRMPCSHIYHKGCIREWLGRSHTCPLCRFPMPSMQTTNTRSNLH